MKTKARCAVMIIVAGICLVRTSPAAMASLTAGEVRRFQEDLGITLSPEQQQQIASIVKPAAPVPQ